MKKLITVLLIIAVAASISACSKKEEEQGTSTVTPSTSSASPSPSTSSASPSTSSQSPSTSTSSPSPSTSSQSPSASSKTPAASKATPTQSLTAYKDGTYDKKGDPWEQGQEEAVVTIEGGKLTKVILMRLDKQGKEVDYSLFNGKEHDGKLYPDLKQYKELLAAQMVGRQSAQVDIISGATVSTKNWMTAAQRALDEARK